MNLCIGSDRAQYGKFKRSWVTDIAMELENCHDQEVFWEFYLRKKCQVNELLPTWIFHFGGLAYHCHLPKSNQGTSYTFVFIRVFISQIVKVR